MLALLAPLAALLAADPVAFEAPKYGVRVALPADWDVKLRERDEVVFAAAIPQADPDRPGRGGDAVERVLSPRPTPAGYGG